MVKIDVGAHIDGYIAVAAHTIVIGASKVFENLRGQNERPNGIPG